MRPAHGSIFFDLARPIGRMTAMRIRRTYLTTILATALATAAAILAAPIANPPNVQLSSASIQNAPLDDIGDLGHGDIPNINVPGHIDVPNVDVPDINMPNINPGHVGLPGRGR
jgi:hypothetical protein